MLYTTSVKRIPDTWLAIDENQLYVCNGSYLDSYNISDGNHLWSSRLRDEINCRPASNNKYVWIVDNSGNKYAFDTNSGEMVYYKEATSAGEIASTVSVINQRVVFDMRSGLEGYQIK